MVDFSINVADAEICLRRASTKRCGQKNTVCFTAVELEKNVASYRDFFLILVRTSTAHRWRSSKQTLGHSARKNKSNNLEPHFPTSATKSRSLEDTKTAVALPHCSESTRDSIAGWWTFRLEVTPELWRKHGTLYIKKTQVEVFPFVDLSGKSAFQIFFCGRCNTGNRPAHFFFRFTPTAKGMEVSPNEEIAQHR